MSYKDSQTALVLSTHTATQPVTIQYIISVSSLSLFLFLPFVVLKHEGEVWWHHGVLPGARHQARSQCLVSSCREVARKKRIPAMMLDTSEKITERALKTNPASSSLSRHSSCPRLLPFHRLSGKSLIITPRMLIKEHGIGTSASPRPSWASYSNSGVAMLLNWVHLRLGEIYE